jgi:hypothetical protein
MEDDFLENVARIQGAKVGTVLARVSHIKNKLGRKKNLSSMAASQI